MREFVANFQKKHGQPVPMPKIYGDEDSSDSDEGLELADGTAVGKKTAGGAGSSGRGRPRKKSAAGGHSSGAGGSGGGGGTRAGDGNGPSTSGGVGGSGGRKRGRDDDGDDDDPNKHRKTGDEGAPPKAMVACKEPRKLGTVYPPDRQKAASSLHLSSEGENLAWPPRVGLDSGAEEEDT